MPMDEPPRRQIATVGDRVIAAVVDDAVGTFLSGMSMMLWLALGAVTLGLVCLCPFPCFVVCIYNLVKDGMDYPRIGMTRGQSLGKRLVGLRVVDYQTGQPADVGKSIIRNFLWVCFCELELLTVLLNDENRRFGDLLAGTIVIEEK